jgi:hypothetical protein
MNKQRWIWIAVAAAGALSALVVLGGCADRRPGQEGHRGGRYAAQSSLPGEGLVTPPESGRRGRGARIATSPPQGPRQESTQRRPEVQKGQAAASFDGNGRGVVEAGELLSLVGRLESRDSVWTLNQEGSRRVLHLGNARYVESTGIHLRDGAEVEVRGFADGREVAVVSIAIDGQDFRFRSDDGVPLWAGQGRRTAGGGGNGAGARGRNNIAGPPKGLDG